MAGAVQSDARLAWTRKPELPEPEEILARASAKDFQTLPYNPVDKLWESKDAYLSAQYKILRCEATEGLRFSVQRYIDADYLGKEMNDDDYSWVYHEVRVKAYLMSRLGPIVRVGLTPSQRVSWQQSKRLMPGKIVALSPKSDGFRKYCLVATIAQRPYRDGLDQDPPLVDLIWAKPTDAVLDPSLEMVLVESRHGYFEAARHALVGLQQAAQTDSPLDKYLIGSHTIDTAPKFLKENPATDLSSLTTGGTSTHHNVLDDGMPAIDGGSLDESQVSGLHRIISSELAIVQGPPGTGKTFTSVEALKVMVATRRRYGGPPIIVSAQTNHALDCLLIRCLDANARVLRVGGRTSDARIYQHTMFQARMRGGWSAPDNNARVIEASRRRAIDDIEELINCLFGDDLLDPKQLRNYGIITEDQFHSLYPDDDMEVVPSLQEMGPFSLWLGDNLIPAQILRNRHPTQLERTELSPEDFEADGDLQNIADDEEDYERIRGKLIVLEQKWSGKEPGHMTSWDHRVESLLGKCKDLFTIGTAWRGVVYQYFQASLLAAVKPKFSALLEKYTTLCKEAKIGKSEQDTQLVERERIDVVGCTTTGLTKYRAFLSALQPRSMLIEEAAETREANIVSALYPSIQQLVLVGDHQQLAPSCDIRWLGESPYNLDVSLFQRMIDLGMPFTMLNQQRRMKPELKKILDPFYPRLTNHQSVLSETNRPDVPGMGGRNCWLFDHTWLEDTNSDHSKFNEQEAQMVVNFFAYLVANGVPATKITILTFYNGQRKVVLSKLKKHGSLMLLTFNVATVDSYQGEENDIILLSMVRSPKDGPAVGFLEDKRRAVVAISRARRGLYLFGNIRMNALKAGKASYEVWANIWNGFAEQEQVKVQKGLPLVCQRHGRETWVKELEDWGDNAGGCDLRCGEMRPCGHRCALRCHPTQDQAAASDARLSQAIAREEMPLEQQLIQAGAEPSSMMMQAAMIHPNAQKSPATRQSRGKTTESTPLWSRAEAASRRDGFRKGVAKNEEKLDQDRASLMKASSETGAPPQPLMRETFRQTSLVDGRRVDSGGGSTQIEMAQRGSTAPTKAIRFWKQIRASASSGLDVNAQAPVPRHGGGPSGSSVNATNDSKETAASGVNPRTTPPNSVAHDRSRSNDTEDWLIDL
ncbi:P-loop containing nucleoside triphosphate hydrolase protein [Lasiosphaeris hirsuta]|uniref:P-loop containing nucleoside triphosphate hydrolase protein n=1 Tax=Lasiosphaeris hirsuta TaxID=260670 RepID=A0AA40B9G8_9PEZI|nr:P-loop containing nucleoside triphosphate hydrolase protein [Lasiosphaeris hirsuta]